METKEKAMELISKFGSKELALICLDEIEDWAERGFDTLDEIRQEINKL